MKKVFWIAICVAAMLTSMACAFSVVPAHCRWPAEAYSSQTRTRVGWHLRPVVPRLRPLKSAKPAAAWVTVEDLGDSMLGIMCKKGRNCTCAKARTANGFDLSLNAIGASEGMGGMDHLNRTRSAELGKVQAFVRNQMSERSRISYRMSLIQVSQCSGIGKTTFLRLIASECPRILQQCGVQLPEAGIITSMITYNGDEMTVPMPMISMETAFVLRMLYGALRMHSNVPGVSCPNLNGFKQIAQNATAAPFILVEIALRILWMWFGSDRPILVAVDEALKCGDGNDDNDNDEKVTNLATLMGRLLERGRYNVPPVLVIASSQSPDRLLNVAVAGIFNRKVDNVVLYPLQQKDAVDVLRSQLLALNPGDRALGQFAALTGGHLRALELTSKFLKGYPDTTWLSPSEEGWIACRKAVLVAADMLTDGTRGTMAHEPDPALFEYLISHAPGSLSGNREITVDGTDRRVDDLIYNGQTIVLPGESRRLTMPSWWLLKYLRTSPETPSKLPFSTLLHECFQAMTPAVTDGGGLYETFSLFFIASAMCRGGEALRAAAPWIQEDFALPSPAAVRIERTPATDIPRNLPSIEKAKRLMAKVEKLRKDQKGITVLVMPPYFPALNAVIIINGQPVGVQFKSNVDDQTVTEKFIKVRKCLDEWKNEGYDILGPSRLISYYIGVDKMPARLTPEPGESFVTAAQLRDHFLDAFFRFGE